MTTRSQTLLRGLIAVCGLAALTACARVVVTLDNPKDGSQINLAVDQPMRVRLTNMDGAGGAWVANKGPGAAIRPMETAVQPSAGGAMQLDTFEYVGAAPGEQHVTFAYVPHGRAATDSMTLRVVVQ